MSRGLVAAVAIGGLGCGALSLLLLWTPSSTSRPSPGDAAARSATASALRALPCAAAESVRRAPSSSVLPPRPDGAAQLCGSAAERSRRGPPAAQVRRSPAAAPDSADRRAGGGAPSPTRPTTRAERLPTRLAGRVVDAHGAPLPGVRVASLDPAARAVTDERGAFALSVERAVGAGLVIQARAEGFVTAQRIVVSQDRRQELDLRLERKHAEAALTISVLNARGERVAGRRVFVTPVGSVDTFSSPTDEDGSCRLESLDPGRVVVWVRAPEGTPASQRRLELLPGENHLDLRLAGP